jgi:two-component system sensor histidine kinase UhpB
MKKLFPGWRGLIQLFAVTILPLTLLLLLVTFGSVTLHERDMRALVGERDERAVQSAAAALESELHHRASIISMLSGENSANADLLSDFDGGVAYFNSDGSSKTAADSALWKWVAQNGENLPLASSTHPEVVFSSPFIDPASKNFFVVVSIYSPARRMTVAGAFTPASLAAETFSSTYPVHSHATIFLMDSSRRLLYVSGMLAPESLPADHPGVAEALRGESGAQYVVMSNAEHVVAYSPIPMTGWALVTEEEWGHVVSPSLQATQMAPLVFVPVFILALIALWFGAKQIVQPLQKLESKAAALAAGDFESINETVGGISEVQHLQKELAEMARKVQAAQEGLHDYIGAITSAQEDERLRLARELHDETIQAVIALKQRVQLAEKLVKDKRGKQALQELENLAEQTVENLRRIIRALRPIYLEDLGLVTALEMLARETKSVPVDFQRSGREQRLRREVELALYRIAQEALSNVARHAQAKSATLNIKFSDDEIKLEISDDGMGFVMPASPTDFAPSGHFGLLGMKERAELIGGQFEVTSQSGIGTQVSVWIPITK